MEERQLVTTGHHLPYDPKLVEAYALRTPPQHDSR